MYLCSVSFYTSFGPNLTVPVPPDYFLVALPTASVSRWIWLSPGVSLICHHTLAAPLYHILLGRAERRFTVAALPLAAVRIKTH